jgi:hypothetical protein
MGKLIYVTFSNGEVWAIDGHVIADDAAKHYAAEVGHGESEQVYDDEYAWVSRDEYTMVDWASSSMNWSDLAPHARLVKKADVSDTKESEWPNARKEVVADA